MSTISAGTTTNTALSTTGDTTGSLVLQTNGTTTAVTLNTSGAIGVGSTPAYGTSGQVLTSGGSAAAPTWATVSAGYTLGTTVTPSGVTTVEFTGIPSTARQVIINFNSISFDTENNTSLQLGTTAGFASSGYFGYTVRLINASGVVGSTSTTGVLIGSLTSSQNFSGSIYINSMGSNIYTITHTISSNARGYIGSYSVTLAGALSKVKIFSSAPSSGLYDSGSINIMYI
jgi:hypothetical protein